MRYTFQYAKKDDLANLKTEVDKLDINKLQKLSISLNSLKSKIDKTDIGILEITPVDLCKLSDVAKNDLVKKTVYNELVKNINAIDTSGLVKKTDYYDKIKSIEDKILSNTDLAAVSGVENEIPSVCIIVNIRK